MATRRIANALEKRRVQGQPALVVYLTAGDPELALSRKLVLAAEAAGADLIELGIPFSDPSADGPVLQKAAERSLARGTTVEGVLQLVREIRSSSEIPIVLFTYYNPVFTFGEGRFAREARRAGVDGLLVVDLPWEEAEMLRTACVAESLDLVPLVAVTTSERRLAEITERAAGFVYVVSMAGVTGAAFPDLSAAERTVSAVRRHTALPVAIGFGVSTAEQARRVALVGDAVVVGSAAVLAAEQGLEKFSAFIATLRAALGARAPDGC